MSSSPKAPDPVAPDLRSTDVVVVGAGIAGLRVADRLNAAGRSVVVLEARDRVGGRLLSRRMAGSGPALDLGASWFWPNEPRVLALMDELELRSHPQHRAGAALYDDPRGVQRLPANPLDVPSHRFSDGAASLALGLASRLPRGTVRLETPATEIRVGGDGVEVTTPGGIVAGEHVVVAVPPALAAHRIRFRPGLPADLARVMEATPVWMGATTKVVVRYARPFWREAGLAGAAVSHLGPLREIHDMSGPGGTPAALFGFASSAHAPAGQVAGDAVIHQLSRLFGPEAGDPEAVEMVDWRREGWTSPPGVERQQRFELYGHRLLFRPIHERIHLASTETAPAFAGHIEGALLAADRVVEVLAGDAGSGRLRRPTNR